MPQIVARSLRVEFELLDLSESSGALRDPEF
jgi:hypothetical protein